MKINKDHMYHGAALTQIAEDPHFKAINAFQKGSDTSRSAFLINNNIGIYLKYATKPHTSNEEYIFTFVHQNLSEVEDLKNRLEHVFLCLVCIEDAQICCISYSEFKALIAARFSHKGQHESSYTVVATLPAGKSFRVYINPPGERNKKLGEFIVPRNFFPGCLFVSS